MYIHEIINTMKKILFVLILVLTTTTSKGQLTLPTKIVGEFKNDVHFGKIQVFSDTYEWIYSNLEQTKRGEKYVIKFKGDPKLIEDLYSILSNQMNKPFKTEFSFNLGDKSLHLFTTDPSPIDGKKLLISIDNTYFTVNESQLNKLFGK